VDYPKLVRDLIHHFEGAVAINLRKKVQGGRLRTFLNLWRHKGALDSQRAAALLDEHFYGPLLPEHEPLFMDHLPFRPLDHDPDLAGSASFNPDRHNWLRTDNVPVLVINATTVNTGHAWQFTPDWMGESPWSVHEVADTVPRLEWHKYDRGQGWRIRVGRAVAASACVPGVFSPLRLERRSKPGAKGLVTFFGRSMETLMERIRQTAYGDLSARVQSGLLRGLMLVHMKDGLDTDPIQLPFSRIPRQLERPPLTPAN